MSPHTPATDPRPDPTPRETWLHGTERWRERERLDVELWHRRTRFMARELRRHLERAEELARPLTLLELGCGAMALERILAEEGLGRLAYVPSDAFARDERTLVIDLNRPDLDALLPDVDVAFLGGVLEYLAEPERVLRSLARRCRYLYLAYCVRTPEQPLSARLGWRNHFSREELAALLGTLGEVEVGPAFDDVECPHLVLPFLVRLPASAGQAAPPRPEVA